MSTETSTTATQRSFADVYAEVNQFYARQMYLLDCGRVEEWVQTFTEDGVFDPPSAPEPIQGRDRLIVGARRAVAELAGTGEQRRHLLLSIDVEQQAGETLQIRSYAQVIGTPRGGDPVLRLICVTHDLLVREGRALKVRHRRVTRDGME